MYTDDTITELNPNRDIIYLISPYGLGDTMILCGLKNAIENKYGAKIHFLIKPIHEIVMRMYGITEYSFIKFSSDFLKHVNDDTSYPCPGKIFVTHPAFSDNGTDHLNKFYNNEFDFLSFYKKWLKLDDNAVFEKPTWWPDITVDFANRLNKIAPIHKIIMICPEANSASMFEKEFWETKIKNLKRRGFHVICNITNKDNMISGAIFFDMSLYECVALSANCARVLSLRSGLCDLIYLTARKLDVFYNNETELSRYRLAKIFGYRTGVTETVPNKHVFYIKKIWSRSCGHLTREKAPAITPGPQP